ncbi:MAG: glycoside hydrolase family 97 catalytic domain-containing protein [Kiritimatiellia bacterium]
MKQTPLMMMVAASVAGCAWMVRAGELGAKATFDRNEIRLYTNPIAYEVVRDGKVVAARTTIGFALDGVCQAKDAKLVRTTTRTLAGTVDTPVYKKSSVDLAGCETYADFGDFGIRLIARRDGVAYRFETKKPGRITGERASVTIPAKEARCWFNRTTQFGREETMPEFCTAGELKTDAKNMYYMPFLYALADDNVVAVTESDVRDYPIWNFGEVKTTANGVELGAKFENYPKATSHVGGWGGEKNLSKGGRWVRITEHADYLVEAPVPRTLPWRTFILADGAAKLCESDIVYALATPKDDAADFSWVKPGKVAWDWWNCFDNIGDPEGCTTKTYERFIDFAAKTGVEYVIFDEGWSAKLNIWEYSPVVDVPYLIDYANRKGVGIILWMAWAQVYGEEEKVAAHFAKLGAKGFKVDFMDRGDARVAQFLEDFAKACAKHKMLVDYHGVYRPTGMHRQYPNILNYEGIHGLEQMKWAPANKDMPYNDVVCFFLRLTAGPMDYTPGAMLNHPYGKYTAGEKCRFPGSVGTRCHQMAMMALYEAPLQMLSDSPTNYEKNMESFTFMAATPVVWADTVAIGGCPTSAAACARKAKDGSWYAAALNNRTAREFTFATAFLGDGEWKAEIFRDTEDGGVNPMKYIHETKTVKAGDRLTFRMAEGGGFVVKFTK